MRLLFTAIPSDRWPLVVRELARVTRRGGWVELVETTGLHAGGPYVELLMEWIRQLSAHRGVDLANSTRVADFMREAGLTNVAGTVIKVPTGDYGGRVGTLVAADFLAVAKGYGGLIVGAGLTTPAQFDQAMAGMEADFKEPRIRCYTPFDIAIGQRAR
jgi:hypothetical protein